MSDYHLKADIPADATDEQVDEIRAGAFKAALTHAATDPKMRLDMIVGETVWEYRHVEIGMYVKLAKESQDVVELARARVTAAAASAAVAPEIQILSAALARIDARAAREKNGG